jgi:hypothetical protein
MSGTGSPWPMKIVRVVQDLETGRSRLFIQRAK